MESFGFLFYQSSYSRHCYAWSKVCLIFWVVQKEIVVFSDGTLNPNGIRFGSAEIYSVVDQFNGEIVDSLCVAQRNPATGNERVILFLKVS